MIGVTHSNYIGSNATDRGPGPGKGAVGFAVPAAVINHALVVASFLAFAYLRRVQLSLPDPYNNPYTTWSTVCVLAFFAFWLCDCLLVIGLRRRLPVSVARLSLAIIVAGGLLIGSFLVNLLRFFAK
jgi:hypothetical protein